LKKKPRIRPPLLTGNDLIALGMKPGPDMGTLLHEIRDKQLSEELKTKRAAKAWAKKKLNRRPPD
jgi:tRNA nucleotidyltransferase/poly(A) polymerase